MNYLLESATAVQSFAWFVDEDERLPNSIPIEVFNKHGPLFVGAVSGAQRLRAIARLMPSGGLRDSYEAVEGLIMRVVSSGNDAWHDDVQNEPDTITRAMYASTDEIRRLYATYPSELPLLGGADVNWRWDVAIVGLLLTAAGLAFLSGWFW